MSGNEGKSLSCGDAGDAGYGGGALDCSAVAMNMIERRLSPVGRGAMAGAFGGAGGSRDGAAGKSKACGDGWE